LRLVNPHDFSSSVVEISFDGLSQNQSGINGKGYVIQFEKISTII
jgi:hypothetical protein